MFKLSAEGLEFVKAELKRYEDPYSAIIPALYRAQDENGWVNEDVYGHLSQVMNLPVSKIQEVAMFYTMFNKTPTGRYHIQVCTNISCSMAKGRELLDHVLDRLGLQEGAMSKDGRFTVSRAECLGSCDTAPVVQVNRDAYLENMSESKIDQVLEKLKRA